MEPRGREDTTLLSDVGTQYCRDLCLRVLSQGLGVRVQGLTVFRIWVWRIPGHFNLVLILGEPILRLGSRWKGAGTQINKLIMLR